MATVIDGDPGWRSEPYPWDEWLDGKVRLLSHGEDFRCSVASLRTLAYLAGTSRGLSLRTRIIGTGLQIQATKKQIT